MNPKAERRLLADLFGAPRPGARKRAAPPPELFGRLGGRPTPVRPVHGPARPVRSRLVRAFGWAYYLATLALLALLVVKVVF